MTFVKAENPIKSMAEATTIEITKVEGMTGRILCGFSGDGSQSGLAVHLTTAEWEELVKMLDAKEVPTSDLTS